MGDKSKDQGRLFSRSYDPTTGHDRDDPRPPEEYPFYGGTAPYERGSATSYDAARRIEPVAGTIRADVLRYIRERGEHGATDEEIEAKLNLRHQTASARRRELVIGGLLIAAGTRPTSSGRQAQVWVATGRP